MTLTIQVGCLELYLIVNSPNSQTKFPHWCSHTMCVASISFTAELTYIPTKCEPCIHDGNCTDSLPALGSEVCFLFPSRCQPELPTQYIQLSSLNTWGKVTVCIWRGGGESKQLFEVSESNHGLINPSLHLPFHRDTVYWRDITVVKPRPSWMSHSC